MNRLIRCLISISVIAALPQVAANVDKDPESHRVRLEDAASLPNGTIVDGMFINDNGDVYLDVDSLDSTSQSRFEFHSDPWMNLHHLLYHAARNKHLAGEKPRGHVPIARADADPAALNAEERVTWNDALTVYATRGRDDLLFDPGLSGIKRTIAEGEAAVRERAKNGEPVFQALLAAMPVYRRHQWSRHEAENRAFIQKLQDALDDHEAALAETLEEIYKSEWSDEPIRVDVVQYANWAGAYTTYGPNHVVMASSDERHGGLLGLEILFHEAGHTEPLGGNLIALSRSVAAKAGVDEDRLWHSYIFYATGDAVRCVVDESHQPYADVHGLWQHGSMAEHKRVLDAYFGSGSLQEQFERMHAARLEFHDDKNKDED